MLQSSEIYTMLGNENLWDAALRTHELLANEDLPHASIGGVALCLHGYQCDTSDIDLLIRPKDKAAVNEVFAESNWHCNVKFLMAGERVGKGAEVRLPDPSDPNVLTELEGLPVLSLPRLIETKLACGMGNARRMHKDFADVVELISMHKLQRSFGRKLHKSLQPAFNDLLERARAE